MFIKQKIEGEKHNQLKLKYNKWREVNKQRENQEKSKAHHLFQIVYTFFQKNKIKFFMCSWDLLIIHLICNKIKPIIILTIFFCVENKKFSLTYLLLFFFIRNYFLLSFYFKFIIFIYIIFSIIAIFLWENNKKNITIYYNHNFL